MLKLIRKEVLKKKSSLTFAGGAHICASLFTKESLGYFAHCLFKALRFFGFKEKLKLKKFELLVRLVLFVRFEFIDELQYDQFDVHNVLVDVWPALNGEASRLAIGKLPTW